MRIVLDTGVFFRPEALAALASRPENVVVQAVALAERVRQLHRDKMDVAAFLAALEKAEFVPEALDPSAACALMPRVVDDARWRRLARDAFVAAHVRPGDELWTTNPRDFLALGLPAEQVVAVPA